jgi:Zn-dependent protease
VTRLCVKAVDGTARARKFAWMNEPPPTLPLTLVPAAASPKRTVWQRLTTALGPVGVVLVMIANFFGKIKFLLLPILKFGLPVLKTGGTMFLSIGLYAMSWGWPFAVGFVLLILVHECGHLIVARQFGLNVSAPMFIPFMGAVIVLKDQPRNAWMEACVGIGGPLLGALGAAVCGGIFVLTRQPLFLALAYSGFFLNLFNLAPIGFLDGGRITAAISPWLWVVGLVILGAMIFTHPNFLLILILLMSLPRVWSLFRAKTDEEKRYFEVNTEQRLTMAVLFFGLVALLVFGMHWAHIAPPLADGR